MNYKDLGYTDELSIDDGSTQFIGATNTTFFEGVDSGQILSLGKIQSPDGQWYIDFDNGEVSLPPGSVKTGMINYESGSINAVVSNSGGGDFKDIQDAIDHVNRRGGGTVYIKEGTYTVSKDITLYSKISLIGDGPGKTVIDFNGPYGISLTGGIAELSLYAFYSDDAYQDISIENIKFMNVDSSNHGIHIQYTRNIRIDRCYFYDCSVYIQTSGPVRITGCTFFGTSHQQQLYVSSLNGVIDNNLFTYTTGKSIYVDGGGNVTYLLVSGNVFDRCDYGMDFASGSNYAVVNNSFYGAGDVNLVMTGDRSIISGNSINGGSLSDGILVENHYVTVSGNNIYGVATAYDNYGDHNRFIGNSADGCARGIRINAGSDRTLYDGNDFQDCTTAVTNNGSNTSAGDNILA